MISRLKNILPFLGIYFLVCGISFVGFSWAMSKERKIISPVEEPQEVPAGGLAMLFSGPKDQECPINGEMFTKEQATIWEKNRPLLVMIENHKDSRPQSGLSRADVVYEAIAEGGITRLMGVYYCRAAAPVERKYDVGPVRSARTYFLDWASEYSQYPLYNHVGGANCSPVSPGGPCTTDTRVRALEQIEQYGWLDPNHHSDMNQFALDYKYCRREPERTGETKATEHTVYCDTSSLWRLAEERNLAGWDKDFFKPWQFKDDLAKTERGTVNNISFDFWQGYKDYSVIWKYNLETNSYLRENGGESHFDFLTQKQIEAKVIVIQFTKETGPVDSHKHMLYGTVGSGKALIFQDGKVISGIWEKASRTKRTVFKDAQGREVKFNRGQIWIEVLPLGNKVDYES